MWPEPLEPNTWEVGMRYCPSAGGGMLSQLPGSQPTLSWLLLDSTQLCSTLLSFGDETLLLALN